MAGKTIDEDDIPPPIAASANRPPAEPLIDYNEKSNSMKDNSSSQSTMPSPGIMIINYTCCNSIHFSTNFIVTILKSECYHYAVGVGILNDIIMSISEFIIEKKMTPNPTLSAVPGSSISAEGKEV